jgi:Ca-activated chloride channel family protein
MTMQPRVRLVAAAALASWMTPASAQEPPADDEGYRFRSGVELINVTATVTDADGRFVPGLRQEDFTVYEDGRPVSVTHFSAERVPVSLGIVLDSSGSMAGDKMKAARGALVRFIDELANDEDEFFLYRFSNYPVLVEDWTQDRSRLASALDRLSPNGGTAMYDAVSEAVPVAQQGRNRKRALVVISDGNDTSSVVEIPWLKRQIRESEVLVYAVGIDGDAEPATRRGPVVRPRLPIPLPIPFPGGGQRPRPRWPIGGGSGQWVRADGRVNAAALREMTDDSGGRTEIVRDGRDLDPATAGIADELSRQYYLGYPSSGRKDGRWHAIRVEVRGRDFHVRARRGYVAN